MRIIEPLVNHGQYVEQHERYYGLPQHGTVDTFAFADASKAHARFLRRWMRDERREDARARRDAREQFQARMEAI
jgi:hypothetical protein